MATAIVGNPQLFQDDQIIYGKCTGTTVITKGDWLQFSGGFLINLVAAVGLTGLRASAVGVALDNHPVYDPLGRSMENTAMPVLTHGVMRVSGGTAVSFTGAPTLGSNVFPAATASGIVGVTGGTGIGGIWQTAAQVSTTGSGAAAWTQASGVGKLINIAKSGDITATQWDIMFDARMLGVGYL
jgi:hypothetical protein